LLLNCFEVDWGNSAVEGGLFRVEGLVKESQPALKLACSSHSRSRGIVPSVVDLGKAKGIGSHIVDTFLHFLVVSDSFGLEWGDDGLGGLHSVS